MNRLLIVGAMLLGMSCVAKAQIEAPAAQPSANAAADFANTSAATSSSLHIASTLLSTFPPAANWAAPAEPAPAAPPPRFIFGGRDDFRFQLGIGMSLVRFRSSVYYATAVGTSTSLTYFTNESFGVEGKFITAFAPTIFQNEHVKYFAYGVGPKLAWRQPRIEPWIHGILGGAHVLPQTALGGQNAFAVQAGGGVDYRFNPRFSARGEVDWVRTHFFGQWQDSGQAVLEGILHF